MFPRTPEQISCLALNVFPSIGESMEELKITGTYDAYDKIGPQTISVAVLDKMKAFCPRLKTLVFRFCRFDLERAAQDNLPSTLETLEFHDCRYSNLCSFSASSIMSDNVSDWY